MVETSRQRPGARNQRVFLLLGAGFWLLSSLQAQRLDPVKWTLSSDISKVPPGSRVALRLTAQLEDGWHLYSPTTPKGTPDNPGPNPTTLALADHPSLNSNTIYQPKPEIKFDPNFNLNTETYEKE